MAEVKPQVSRSVVERSMREMTGEEFRRYLNTVEVVDDPVMVSLIQADGEWVASLERASDGLVLSTQAATRGKAMHQLVDELDAADKVPAPGLFGGEDEGKPRVPKSVVDKAFNNMSWDAFSRYIDSIEIIDDKTAAETPPTVEDLEARRKDIFAQLGDCTYRDTAELMYREAMVDLLIDLETEFGAMLTGDPLEPADG